MKRKNTIQIGLILSVMSLLLISINPVVGYVSTESSIKESIVEMDDAFDYIAIPSVCYQKFKEIVDDIEDEEIKESMEYMVAEWDYYGYEDGVTMYIPILCECVSILVFIVSIYILYMDEFIGINTPIAEVIFLFLFVIWKSVCPVY